MTKQLLTDVISDVSTPLGLPLSNPSQVSTCFAIEKRGLANKPCVFPFKYKGNVYNGCITKNDPDGKAW